MESSQQPNPITAMFEGIKNPNKKKRNAPGVWHYARPVKCLICQEAVVQAVAIRDGKRYKSGRYATSGYICFRHTK